MSALDHEPASPPGSRRGLGVVLLVVAALLLVGGLVLLPFVFGRSPGDEATSGALRRAEVEGVAQYHLLAGRYDFVVTFSGTSLDPERVEAMARTLEIDPALLAAPGTQAALGHPADVEHGVQLGL